MYKYVFIAVNYNGSKYTIDYINSINRLSLKEEDEVEIIIVDNSSDAEDLKKIDEYATSISKIKIIKLPNNIGYFKGLNKGIKIVDKNDNPMLIIGNNDLTFDQGFILNLKKIKYENNVLVIAPNIFTKDGRQQNPHVVDKIPFIEKLKSRIYFSNYYVGQSLHFINQNIKKLVKKNVVLQNNYGQMKIKRGIGACYVLTPFFLKYFDSLDDRD